MTPEEITAALLPDQPIYIVRESDGPPEQSLVPDCWGCTGKKLDLALKPFLVDQGLWEGRHPAIYLADESISEFCRTSSYAPDAEYVILATTLHELAHVAEVGLDDDDESPEMQRIATTFVELSRISQGNIGITRPAWLGHDHRFIRQVLHVHHRASLLGCEIAAEDIFNALEYGLPATRIWKHAIANEPYYLSHLSLFDISNCEPPLLFKLLTEHSITEEKQSANA